MAPDVAMYSSFFDEFTKLSFELHGHTTVQGIPIAIENRVGSTRSGKNEDGSAWKTKFKIPYGYIKKSKGADGEEVDAYVGPHKEAPTAYVIHQLRDDGKHDEDTVMLGFQSKAEARAGILAHYDNPDLIGATHSVPIERLKKLLASGKKLVKISTPRMDVCAGDAPSADGPEHRGKNPYGRSTSGLGEPASPDQTLRLFIGNVNPSDTRTP